jgi:hypothetical protein
MTTTPSDRETFKRLVQFSFHAVETLVSSGTHPHIAVTHVITTLLKKRVITISKHLYREWCQALLLFAEQKAANSTPIEPHPRQGKPEKEEKKQKAKHIHPPSIVLGRDVETGKKISVPGPDRSSGIYHIGNTKVGKSTMMVSAALRDARQGCSLMFVDPHGSAIMDFIQRCPKERLPDSILIEPGNMTHLIGVNLLTRTTSVPIDADATRLMDFLKRLWGYTSTNSSWGPNMENLLRASILTLLYNPGTTLAELPYLYGKDEHFREKMLESVPETQEGFFVRRYWREEYNRLPPEKKAEWASPIRNKINQLLMVRATLHILAQEVTTINFSDCMEKGKIILVHLSERLIGSDGVHFIGTLLLEEVVKTIFKRDPGGSSPFCSLYIDEFEKFASTLFVEALPQVRKFNVGFYLCNQYFQQLKPPELQGAVRQLAHQITSCTTTEDATLRAPLYAKAPPDETREQEKEVPVLHPLNHLLFGSGRPHKSDIVVTFAKRWKDVLRSANTAIREGGRVSDTASTVIGTRGRARHFGSHSASHWSNRADVVQARFGVDEMEEYLHTCMVEKNARRVISYALFNWMVIQFRLPLRVRPESHGLEVSPLECFDWLCGDFPAWKHWFVDNPVDLPPDFLSVYEHLWTAAQVHDAIAKYEQWVRRDWTNKLTALLREWVVSEHGVVQRQTVALERMPSFVVPWQEVQERVTFETSLQALEKITLDRRELEWNKHFSPRPTCHPLYAATVGNERILQTLVSTEVDTLMASWKPVFTEFVMELRAVTDALVASPPLTTNGEKEMVTVPSRRSRLDMEKEMAQELGDLPNYTAYVRIRSGKSSTKAKIQSYPLPDGVKDEKLQTRLTQIQEQTKHYGTSEEALETQLHERRVRFGIVPSPAPAPPNTAPKPQTPANGSPLDGQAKKQPQTTPAPASTTPTKQAPPAASPAPAAPLRIAKRRVHAPAPGAPAQALTFSDDFVLVAFHLHFYTLKQVCRLLGKTKPHEVTHTREKLNDLVAKKLLAKKPIPQEIKAPGRVPDVFFLAPLGMEYVKDAWGLVPGKRNGECTTHTLLCTDALITLALLPTSQTAIILTSLLHERYFKEHSIPVGANQALEPDGLLQYTLAAPWGVRGEVLGLALEVDRGFQQREYWQNEKLRKYLALAGGIYQDRFHSDSLTIAVYCAGGNMPSLLKWTEEMTKERSDLAGLFLFSASDPATTDPVHWCTSPLWSVPFQKNPVALIEKKSL